MSRFDKTALPRCSSYVGGKGMAVQAESRITPPPSVPLPEAKITPAQTLQDMNCEATLTRHALTAWWD